MQNVSSTDYKINLNNGHIDIEEVKETKSNVKGLPIFKESIEIIDKIDRARNFLIEKVFDDLDKMRKHDILINGDILRIITYTKGRLLTVEAFIILNNTINIFNDEKEVINQLNEKKSYFKGNDNFKKSISIGNDFLSKLFDDNVYLVCKKPYGDDSPFRDNLILIVQDGKTKFFTKIVLKENTGYNPTLFLGDFTSNKVKDILISIDSGGSGGYAFYYIYSFLRNVPKVVFDFEKFNEKYTYTVNFKDNYEVQVTDKNNNKYIINIRYKGEEYLSEIYDENGNLKEPIEGWVNPLGGLYPVDFRRDGTYELYATRSIAGRYNADVLGYVQTSLEWNGKDFKPFFQTLGILGSNY